MCGTEKNLWWGRTFGFLRVERAIWSIWSQRERRKRKGWREGEGSGRRAKEGWGKRPRESRESPCGLMDQALASQSQKGGRRQCREKGGERREKSLEREEQVRGCWVQAVALRCRGPGAQPPAAWRHPSTLSLDAGPRSRLCCGWCGWCWEPRSPYFWVSPDPPSSCPPPWRASGHLCRLLSGTKGPEVPAATSV